MSDATPQSAAEEGVRQVASAIGAKDLTPLQVAAIAAAVVHIVELGTATTWKAVEKDAQAAADAITTDAQAAEVLRR